MTLADLQHKENHSMLYVKTMNPRLTKCQKKGKKGGTNPISNPTKWHRCRKEKSDQQDKEDEELPCKNCWPYKEEIPIMPESSKLTDVDLLTLCCQDRY